MLTDEAHRTQYDTLALNLRSALPNALFLAFTGTPLIAGEELTRKVFGDFETRILRWSMFRLYPLPRLDPAGNGRSNSGRACLAAI